MCGADGRWNPDPATLVCTCECSHMQCVCIHATIMCTRIQHICTRVIVLGRIHVSYRFISNSVMASDLWLVICGLRLHTNNYVLSNT